jgi:hypothetical protein
MITGLPLDPPIMKPSIKKILLLKKEPDLVFFGS